MLLQRGSVGQKLRYNNLVLAPSGDDGITQFLEDASGLGVTLTVRT